MILTDTQTNALLNLSSYVGSEDTDFPENVSLGFKAFLEGGDGAFHGKMVISAIDNLLTHFGQNTKELDKYLTREIGWAPALAIELPDFLRSIKTALLHKNYRLADF